MSFLLVTFRAPVLKSLRTCWYVCGASLNKGRNYLRTPESHEIRLVVGYRWVMKNKGQNQRTKDTRNRLNLCSS